MKATLIKQLIVLTAILFSGKGLLAQPKVTTLLNSEAAKVVNVLDSCVQNKKELVFRRKVSTLDSLQINRLTAQNENYYQGMERFSTRLVKSNNWNKILLGIVAILGTITFIK